MEVFKARPGGGKREAKAPLWPFGQERAKCPKRPQFLIEREEDDFRQRGEPDETTLDSRSTSDRCSGAEGLGTRPGYGPHHRTSSIAWRQLSGVADKPPIHGPAGGSCSKAAAQKSSSLQCAPLQRDGYDVGYRRIPKRPAVTYDSRT